MTLLLIAQLATRVVAANPVDRPAFGGHRFDEDWRAYCARFDPPPVWDRLKCLKLADRTTASIGADLRLRVEAVHRPGFGLSQP
ncbi:hypothetical protein K2X89_12550, partial [Myxococcota bacterium]|nr:hypothetical protein [Myxococcota bacterium]